MERALNPDPLPNTLIACEYRRLSLLLLSQYCAHMPPYSLPLSLSEPIVNRAADSNRNAILYFVICRRVSTHIVYACALRHPLVLYRLTEFKGIHFLRIAQNRFQ